jgi:hypothetical protein
MEQNIEEMKKMHLDVKGWGVDADRKNDPTYPIKRRTNGEHRGYSWERPSQQPATVEVLHSNERPNLSTAFGTSTPPTGLSGMLRRLAFRFSESSYGHWLPLMLADRVNTVEGCVDDLVHGKVPNLFEECGWRAEWQHNRKAFVTRLSVRALLVGAIVSGVIAMNGQSRRKRELSS